MMSLSSPHGRKLSLERPIVMGILNMTPDSFYDGGKFIDIRLALARAQELIEKGVDILDIGGESTGPGSRFIEAHEELLRVIHVIKALRSFREKKIRNIWISIDTYKAVVAEKALEAGADMVNDVTALRGDPEMARVLVKSRAPIILMYAKDATPRTTRKKVRYHDVIAAVKFFLKKRVAYALQHGVQKSQIIIDPGMGAFVSGLPKYSFEILRRLSELKKLGYPICVGPSMKSFLGGKTWKTGKTAEIIEDRKISSIFSAWLARQNGASVLRVHHFDVIALLRAEAYSAASAEPEARGHLE